jgi:hypothetical protein
LDNLRLPKNNKKLKLENNEMFDKYKLKTKIKKLLKSIKNNKNINTSADNIKKNEKDGISENNANLINNTDILYIDKKNDNYALDSEHTNKDFENINNSEKNKEQIKFDSNINSYLIKNNENYIKVKKFFLNFENRLNLKKKNKQQLVNNLIKNLKINKIKHKLNNEFILKNSINVTKNKKISDLLTKLTFENHKKFKNNKLIFLEISKNMNI